MPRINSIGIANRDSTQETSFGSERKTCFGGSRPKRARIELDVTKAWQ